MSARGVRDLSERWAKTLTVTYNAYQSSITNSIKGFVVRTVDLLNDISNVSTTRICRTTYIRPNDIRSLNTHIINRRRHGPRPHRPCVPRRDRHKHGVDVRHGVDQDSEDPRDPGTSVARQDFERDDEWENPPLAEGREKESFIELFGEPGEAEQVDDEDYVCGDCEEVGFEGWELLVQHYAVFEAFTHSQSPLTSTAT